MDSPARISSWEELIRSHSNLDARHQILCFESLGSTMDFARQMAGSIARDASAVILAREQTNGRGRQGRRWEQAHSGMYATFVVPCPVPVSALSGLSLMIGCVLSDLLISLGAEVGLKWPNDIMSRDGQKLSGVLIEIASEKGASNVLVGVGINLAGAPEAQASATSLQALCGREYQAPEVAASLYSALLKASEVFFKQGFSSFRDNWMSKALFLGAEFEVDSGHSSSEVQKEHGYFLGVSNQGHLLLNSGGAIREIVAGHVTKIGAAK